MAGIDVYVQHLYKHEALEVLLASESPVTFRFAAGDRASNQPLTHAQLTGLVQEVAPTDALDMLRRMGRARFAHSAGEGLNVLIDIEVVTATSWKVSIAPGRAQPARPQPQASMSPPAAAPPAQRAPIAPPVAAEAAPAAAPAAPPPQKAAHVVPRIELAAGEPPVNRLFRMMIALGASDLHVSSDEVPMVRLHGEMTPIEPGAPKLTSEQVRTLLYPALPEKNIREFEENWDTDFAYSIEGLARFRGNMFMDRKGAGGVFRQIPFEIMSAEKLGIPKQVLDLCYLSKGLVVVTGPTGSGKSTTLATLIDVINSTREDHLITIEDPIEFVHPNKKCLVNQREIGTHTKSFKSALRAALREDPDIMLVGEMRDLETISIAIETAETGHLVFGTLHTTTAPSTVDRIIDQFSADRQEQIRTMLSESLRGVIAQVLCKKIGGGRVAAYEVLITNPAVSNLIREGKTYQLTSVMQTGKNLGMQTMNDHLLDHVKNGRVEPKEAFIKAADKLGLKELFTRNNIKLDL
jgi:twitching motility protein PilT